MATDPKARVKYHFRDYYKVQAKTKSLEYNACYDCDLYDTILNECLVKDDDRFVCWADDTTHNVVMQYIFKKKGIDDDRIPKSSWNNFKTNKDN